LIGATGIATLSSMAFNPLDGQLWAVAMNDRLYKIDKTNSQSQLVGQTGFSQTPAIGFDSDGKLFGITGYSQTIKSQLILINQSDGTGSLIGSTGFNLLTGLIIKGSVTVSADEKNGDLLPSAFGLSQNYPNPFNPSTVISYQLAVGSQVTLKIFDVIGNEVGTLVNEEKPAGVYEVTFNAANLSSGVYFYKLSATSGAGNFVETRKMILIR
jgi:hypothetical protein